jgi:hypothetical protein
MRSWWSFLFFTVARSDLDLSTVLKKAATGEVGSLCLVLERVGELRGSNCNKIESSPSAVAAIVECANRGKRQGLS